jgi:hypothetical protein
VQITLPAADVPEPAAAFVGVWEGVMGEGANAPGIANTILIAPSARLAVEQVGGGQARIIFGLSETTGRPGDWSSGRAAVSPDGVIHFGGNPGIVLTMNPDQESINARIESSLGLRLGIRFTRCSMGETVLAAPAPAVAPPPVTPPARPSAPAGAPVALSAGQPASGAQPATASPPRIFYRDDFAEPRGDWPRRSSNPTWELGYDGGEYFLRRLPAQPGTTVVTRREGFVDFEAQVEAALAPPTEGGYLVLAIRRQENGDQYALQVDPNDRTYRLLRRANNRNTNLIGWTPASGLNAGAEPNRIGVRAQGTNLTILINGQELRRVQDDAFREGWVALGVGHRADGQAEARFRSLVIAGVD